MHEIGRKVLLHGTEIVLCPHEKVINLIVACKKLALKCQRNHVLEKLILAILDEPMRLLVLPV